MNLRSIVLLFAVCFLLSNAFAAISGQEALAFASKNNYFLQGNEIAEISPNVKITHNSKAYWAVSIVSGDSLTGLIPVSVDSASIPSKNTDRKKIIETAYYLRSHDQIKRNALQYDQWVFSSLNSKRMDELATKLKSESSLDLTTIESELTDYPALLGILEEIKQDIESMHPKATALASELSATSSFESNFYNNPDTSDLETLKAKFENAFGKITVLEQEKTAYLLDVDELLQGIAQTGLAIETKQSLGALANAPQREIAFVSGLSNSSANLKDSLLGSFDTALSRSQTLADDLETRIKRNNSYAVLYGQDNDIIEKTSASSLEGLVGLVLSDEYQPYWKNQEELAGMRDSWQKAEAYFKNGNFETAVSFAAKTKKSALKVHEDGFTEPDTMLDTDFLITMAVLIIILLIILYAVKNRKKLFSLVSEPEEEPLEFD